MARAALRLSRFICPRLGRQTTSVKLHCTPGTAQVAATKTRQPSTITNPLATGTPHELGRSFTVVSCSHQAGEAHLGSESEKKAIGN